MKVGTVRHICYKSMKTMCPDVIKGESESWLRFFVSSTLVLHQDSECQIHFSVTVFIYESSHHLKQCGAFSYMSLI